MLVGAGAVAQEAGNGDLSSHSRYDLDQFIEILNPDAFSLVERVQWGTRLFLAPSYFKNMIPLYIYNPRENFSCDSSGGRALVDGEYGITMLNVYSTDNHDESFVSSENTAAPSGAKLSWWPSRDAYCGGEAAARVENLQFEGMQSQLQANLLQIFEVAEENQQQVLVGTGPIPGGEAVARLWAECDLEDVLPGSACADRLGWSQSVTNKSLHLGGEDS